MDVIEQFKTQQKRQWAGFGVLEFFTAMAAPRLVRFARVSRTSKVLDVACGTGVVALTAARTGASVTGIDLTPELIERARENTHLMGVEVEWKQGDAEALPFESGTFDVVVSQFGHMFAPRPEVAVAELLRVLRPGGTLAFATWPPELCVGRMFALAGRYAPTPPPAGVSPPTQWGEPSVIRERLGNAVRDLHFDRDVLKLPVLSPQHARTLMETIGPMGSLVKLLEADPAKLTAFRGELEGILASYFEDNTVRKDYLLTRATKA